MDAFGTTLGKDPGGFAGNDQIRNTFGIRNHFDIVPRDLATPARFQGL